MLKENVIVFTAIQETWGHDDDIIFLGEWCKGGSVTDCWKTRAHTTMEDPWSDRERRFKAFNYTEELYQKIIPLIASRLNAYHGVKYSQTCWEIVCGPWLKLFINRAFHIWEAINQALAHYPHASFYCVDTPDNEYIPTDMIDFEKKIISDEWNQFIFEKLMFSMGVKSKGATAFKRICDLKRDPRRKLKPGLTGLLASQFFKLIANCRRYSAQFVVSTPYLDRRLYLKLILRACVLPLSYPEIPTIKKNVDLSLRSKNLPLFFGTTKFEIFLAKNVFGQIPTAYLEGFNDYQKYISSRHWPRNPRKLLTAVDHFSNDIFKIYAAKCVAEGSRLVLISHGGGGKYKYSDFQSMEYRLCDRFVTWGWSDDLVKSERGYFLKAKIQTKKCGRSSEKLKLTHIILSKDRYQKFIDATPSYNQYLDYLKDQFSFLKGLTPLIRGATVVKLSHDSQNVLLDRFKQELPELKVATVADDFYDVVGNSRLVVATYNATTFVETIFSDIPTVIFWNPEHWELSVRAEAVFNRLRAVGVFHESPDSVSRLVNQIFQSVDLWWYSPEVRAALSEFRSEFCRSSSDPLGFIKRVLQS